MTSSLADQLAFDALEPEVRAMIERVMADRKQDDIEERLRDAYADGHADGYEQGHADGHEDGYKEGEQAVHDRIEDSLCTKCGSDVSACFNCGVSNAV